MRLLAQAFLFLSAASGLTGEAQDTLASREDELAPAKRGHFVTNVVQFRTLSDKDFLDGCAFRLTGVVTLVDASRNLVVLQDATGAVAVNFEVLDDTLQVGRMALLESTNCCPYVGSFPDFPFRPSGWEIRPSFEAPTDWSEYHLTRM
ncbi:MAG TPA: hypothetical protein VI457_10065, partial [Methylococcaceae bacterium]|nr:hypothetical protein [Methylococcaceae bacterium]